MNAKDRNHDIDELRWQAQEKARCLEPDADAVDLRIARALRRAPSVELPLDFAAQVASLARAQATAPAVAEQALFEQRLLRGLTVLFALSAAVVVAWYGRGWIAALATALPGGSDAVGWSSIAALCVLANWGFGAIRRQLERGSHTSV